MLQQRKHAEIVQLFFVLLHSTCTLTVTMEEKPGGQKDFMWTLYFSIVMAPLLDFTVCIICVPFSLLFFHVSIFCINYLRLNFKIISKYLVKGRWIRLHRSNLPLFFHYLQAYLSFCLYHLLNFFFKFLCLWFCCKNNGKGSWKFSNHISLWMLSVNSWMLGLKHFIPSH